MCSTAAPTRPVRTTATWPICPACWRGCRWPCPAPPSTACAARGRAPWARRRAPPRAGRPIGWRFVNRLMKDQYGVDSMPETAENVAADFGIERQAQDRMALASQRNAVAAQQAGHLAREICPVTIAQKKGEAIVVRQDEHPRDTSLDALAKLR